MKSQKFFTFKVHTNLNQGRVQMSRTEKQIKRIIETVGAIAFVLGLGGLAGAVETGNGFLPSAIVFAFGLATSLYIFNR